MDPLDLARWQFGITTVYHFIFVPLTLGMSLFVAIFQTAWYRTANIKWLYLTRFFGKNRPHDGKLHQHCAIAIHVSA